jgi:hypothetical protein
MARPKITITGELRFSQEGLLYPILVGKPPKISPVWVEAMNVEGWPGLGNRPSSPQYTVAYDYALHSDPAYRKAASEFMKRQRREPQQLNQSSFGELDMYPATWR